MTSCLLTDQLGSLLFSIVPLLVESGMQLLPHLVYAMMTDLTAKRTVTLL